MYTFCIHHCIHNIYSNVYIVYFFMYTFCMHYFCEGSYIHCKQVITQNNGQKRIHPASIFEGMLTGKSKGIFYIFECEILLKNEYRLQAKNRITNHCKTCPDKVEISNTSDCHLIPDGHLIFECRTDHACLI